MDFCEAMNILKNGGKVTREVWKGALYFMMKDDEVHSYQPRLLDYSYDESIMLSDGWFVEGDEKAYSFCEIIPFLNEGKRAQMEDWQKDWCIFLDKGTGKLLLRMMDSFPFVPGFDSFVATDWIQE